jgi:hypothetical protein
VNVIGNNPKDKNANPGPKTNKINLIVKNELYKPIKIEITNNSFLINFILFLTMLSLNCLKINKNIVI